jgi:hypothetical protein
MNEERVREVLDHYREVGLPCAGDDVGDGTWIMLADHWEYAERREAGSVDRFLAELRQAVGGAERLDLTEAERADLRRLADILEQEWARFRPVLAHELASEDYNLPGEIDKGPDTFRDNRRRPSPAPRSAEAGGRGLRRTP